MGKKRRILTSNKYNTKRSAWLEQVRKTQILVEQVEETIETVQETNRVVADKTSTIELVDPVVPLKKKTTTRETTTKKTKKTTKQ
jgi:hypothetical protein